MADTLALHRMGAVLVIALDTPKSWIAIDQIGGIISERDIVRVLIVARSSGDVLSMAAAAVMIESHTTIAAMNMVRDVAILMKELQARYVPVIRTAC